MMTGETEITNWEFDPPLAPVGRLIDNGELLLSETTTTEPPLIDPTIYATNEELYHAILALASALFLSILYPLFLVCKCLTNHCRRSNVVNETWRSVPRIREVAEVPMQQVYVNHPPIVPCHSCVKQ
jgi:hypothetical protein